MFRVRVYRALASGEGQFKYKPSAAVRSNQTACDKTCRGRITVRADVQGSVTSL